MPCNTRRTCSANDSALTIHAPVLDLSSRRDIAAVADRLSGREVSF